MQDKQYIENLQFEVDDLLSKIKFIPSQDQENFDKLIVLYEKLYDATKQVIYLIEICRAEKKLLGMFSKLSKNASERAFKARPMEKTLFFYLANHVANQPADKAIVILENAFKDIKDSNLLAVKTLYLGCLKALKGDYISYNKNIFLAKKNYVPGLYWQLSSVVDNFDCGKNETLFLGKKLEFLFPDIPDHDFIMSISCDQVYFDNYAEYYLKSFFKHNSNAVVHIYIVNAIDGSMIYKDLRNWLGLASNRVVVNFFDCPSHIDYKPISAVLRLLIINQLLLSYRKPVFFGEIDAVILNNLNDFIQKTFVENAAQLVRLVGSYLPWQRFTCGFGMYLYNEYSVNSSQLLFRYILGVFNNTVKHYWADQCALEGAIRYSILLDPQYSYYSPRMEEINKIIYTPTGADLHDKKKSLLISKYLAS